VLDVQPATVNGKHGTATAWQKTTKFDPHDAAQRKQAQGDFATHAWLANWDAIGLDNDNVATIGSKMTMIDPGGAMLYVSLAARLWGIEVGLVTVAGDDYPIETLERLAARSVDLAGVRRIDRPSVRNWLLYEPRGRQVVQQQQKKPSLMWC